MWSWDAVASKVAQGRATIWVPLAVRSVGQLDGGQSGTLWVALGIKCEARRKSPIDQLAVSGATVESGWPRLAVGPLLATHLYLNYYYIINELYWNVFLLNMHLRSSII